MRIVWLERMSNLDDVIRASSGQPIAPEMLTLAEQIVDSKAGDFDPSTFRDRYEEALLAHLKAKQAGAVGQT
jgi:non-homologous end joining protein Ku